MECYVTKYYHNYKIIPKITLLVSICCPVSDFDESVMYRHPQVFRITIIYSTQTRDFEVLTAVLLKILESCTASTGN